MMLKKYMAILGTLMLFGIMQVVAQSPKSAIVQLQQLRFSAMVNKDTTYLRSCTDDGLVYVHSNGLVQSKKDFIQSISTQMIVYQDIKPKEQAIRMYKKAAIINGVVQVKGLINGNPFDVVLRYTDVYVYKKGWKMASWHSLKL